MSSKIRVGLSKTGLVLSTATHLCSFKSYYSSTIVGFMLGILHGCRDGVGLVWYALFRNCECVLVTLALTR